MSQLNSRKRKKIKEWFSFEKCMFFLRFLLNINGSTVFLFRTTARGVVQPSEHKVPGCTDLFRVSFMGVVVLLLKRWPSYSSCRWNRGWNGCKSPDASAPKHNSAPLLTTRNPQLRRKARHQIGNGITDQRDHAFNCRGALSSADKRTTLDTRNMSRIVARLFAVACQHTTSRSVVVAGRTPVFIRSLSSSQGKGSIFFFDRSLRAAVSLTPASAQC